MADLGEVAAIISAVGAIAAVPFGWWLATSTERKRRFEDVRWQHRATLRRAYARFARNAFTLIAKAESARRPIDDELERAERAGANADILENQETRSVTDAEKELYRYFVAFKAAYWNIRLLDSYAPRLGELEDCYVIEGSTRKALRGGYKGGEPNPFDAATETVRVFCERISPELNSGEELRHAAMRR